jgi:hypothetical protein
MIRCGRVTDMFDAAHLHRGSMYGRDNPSSQRVT